MSTKIYISLKEAEDLIFNKCLTLFKNRLDIQRAQDLLSVNIIMDSEDFLQENSRYIILFSAVKTFEIPKKDEVLFLNHYRVPAGLLNTVERKVRDIPKDENILPFEENEAPVDYKGFLRLRNGLVGILHYSQEMRTSGISDYEGEKLITHFNTLSLLQQSLLSELLEEKTLPILRVNVDKFVTENFYRVTWWGKFISENYLKTLNIKNEEELKNIRLWLRGFLDFEKIDTLNQQLSNVPIELKGEINFLLGYYFAAIKLESFNLKNDFFLELYSEIVYDHKKELFKWISFFISFFDSNISQLYFIESLRNDIYKIEKLAFELIQNKFQINEKEQFNLNLKKLEKSSLVTEYVQLKNGDSNKAVQLIRPNDVKNVFQNNLSETSLKTVGFELNSQYQTYNLDNYCWTTNEIFHLTLNNAVSHSEINFYIHPESKIAKKLKQLKIKTKPLKKLLEGKKILVGFFPINKTPKSINLYSSLLREEIDRDFEKIVIVLLVDLEVEKIQSLEFAQFVKSQKSEYERLFKTDLHLIVKNSQTKNDVEIKRNLKNLLENYRIDQIEIIDENFDTEKATWLIDGNSEYYIDKEGNNYYSFLNIN